MRPLTIAVLVLAAGCGSSVSPFLGTAAPAQPPPAPSVAPPPATASAPRATPPGELPPGGLDAQRRAAEDPMRSCAERNPARCRWVELWRRHLTDDLKLPAEWVAQHVTVDRVSFSGGDSVFQVDATVSVDWVTVRLIDGVRVRAENGGAFESDEAVAARLRAPRMEMANTDPGARLKPFARAVSRAEALRTMATCHGAAPAGKNEIELTEGRMLLLRGTAPAGADADHCWLAQVDLETGKMTGCGQMLCRVQ